jgi:hypothetical protein
MPQITQLPFIFFSQLFWLLLVFGIIFSASAGECCRKSKEP